MYLVYATLSQDIFIENPGKIFYCILWGGKIHFKNKAIILDYRYRGLIKVEALFKLIRIKGLIHSEELVKLLETFLLINVRNNEEGTSIHYKI